MQQETSGMHDSQELCIECGGARLIERVREQSFAYGPPGDQVLLTASMPVFICEDCGYESFDERGEAARHAAVCRHLGVQTPDEVRMTRERTGLSRAEFCQLAGFGPASLQRCSQRLQRQADFSAPLPRQYRTATEEGGHDRSRTAVSTASRCGSERLGLPDLVMRNGSRLERRRVGDYGIPGPKSGTWGTQFLCPRRWATCGAN